MPRDSNDQGQTHRQTLAGACEREADNDHVIMGGYKKEAETKYSKCFGLCTGVQAHQQENWTNTKRKRDADKRPASVLILHHD